MKRPTADSAAGLRIPVSISFQNKLLFCHFSFYDADQLLQFRSAHLTV